MVSDDTQYETFVAQTVTGVGHLVRIGHDGGDQILLADHSGTGINIDFLRVERILVPINTVGLTETQINVLIQAALEAAVTGNTETGINVTHNADGTVDFVVAAAPPATHSSYINVKADTVPTEVNALAGETFVGNAGPIPAYAGAMHVLFYRPTSEGDFTAVYLYQDGSPNTQNQISAWTQAAATVDVGGEDHNVLYSIDVLTGAGGFIVEVV